MNSVHSSIAASQGHRSLARASQSQLEIKLVTLIASVLTQQMFEVCIHLYCKHFSNYLMTHNHENLLVDKGSTLVVLAVTSMRRRYYFWQHI
jgi:hypothetical protein